VTRLGTVSMNGIRARVSRATSIIRAVARRVGFRHLGPILKPAPATDYRPSHQSLLVKVPPRRFGRTRAGIGLGCVFLPVSRSFTDDLKGLELAVKLAVQQRCYLVVAYSKRARPDDFPVGLRQQLGERLILVNHSRAHLDWKPKFESPRHQLSRFHRGNDASEKRNLGLAMASVFGWSSMLFMDDDISAAESGPTLNPVGLAHALAVLKRRPELRAIGWSARNKEDHSVIGHARRLVGMEQDLFVGAGALLVRCEEITPFFPNIYNHDWLFVIALAKNSPDPLRAIGWAGTVRQAEYDPYIPKRARSEETGDLYGECLMNLLEDHGRGFEAFATQGFWAEARASRGRLITTLGDRVGQRAERSQGTNRLQLLKVGRALAAAAEVNRDTTAADLSRYVRVLAADERRWKGQLTALNEAFVTRPDVRRALPSLMAGKPPTPRWKDLTPPAAERVAAAAGSAPTAVA
jgi:hypothetical protein